MEVTRVEGVEAYRDLVAPLLGRAPARHNLMLGLLDVLRHRPDSYQGFDLWAVRDDGRVVAAALQTPPFNLALAEPIDPAALAPLAVSIVDAAARPPIRPSRPRAPRRGDRRRGGPPARRGRRSLRGGRLRRRVDRPRRRRHRDDHAPGDL